MAAKLNQIQVILLGAISRVSLVERGEGGKEGGKEGRREGRKGGKGNKIQLSVLPTPTPLTSISLVLLCASLNRLRSAVGARPSRLGSSVELHCRVSSGMNSWCSWLIRASWGGPIEEGVAEGG